MAHDILELNAVTGAPVQGGAEIESTAYQQYVDAGLQPCGAVMSPDYLREQAMAVTDEALRQQQLAIAESAGRNLTAMVTELRANNDNVYVLDTGPEALPVAKRSTYTVGERFVALFTSQVPMPVSSSVSPARSYKDHRRSYGDRLVTSKE